MRALSDRMFGKMANAVSCVLFCVLSASRRKVLGQGKIRKDPCNKIRSTSLEPHSNQVGSHFNMILRDFLGEEVYDILKDSVQSGIISEQAMEDICFQLHPRVAGNYMRRRESSGHFSY